MSNSEQEYAKSTFNEVAQKYDAIDFFKISADYVSELLPQLIPQDAEVLDVACGTGNVVLACAARLPKAYFDAIDISEGMLSKAKTNAKERGIENITFHLGDITQWQMPKRYDVITCAYALFFLPDAHAVLQQLVAGLKAGGKVIFTTFTADAFMPATQILLDLLRHYGSPSATEYDEEKWENLRYPHEIEKLCALAGVQSVRIDRKTIRYPMDLDAWWALFNNTGYKGMLMELDEEGFTSLKEAFYAQMHAYCDAKACVELNADSYITVVA